MNVKKILKEEFVLVKPFFTNTAGVFEDYKKISLTNKVMVNPDGYPIFMDKKSQRFKVALDWAFCSRGLIVFESKFFVFKKQLESKMIIDCTDRRLKFDYQTFEAAMLAPGQA